jgi:anti-sigma B factor antagonist
MLDFDLSTADLGGGIVGVIVAGEVDLLTAPELKTAIADAIDSGTRRILVDLTAGTFIDSTTLGVLMGAAKRLGQDGGSLAIACDNPGLRSIFEITQLDTVLPIVDSREAAVALLEDLGDEQLAAGAS